MICTKIAGFSRAVFGPPGGPERAQTVAPGTSLRTPTSYPNPANGDPIGGKKTFWDNRRAVETAMLVMPEATKAGGTPFLAHDLLRERSGWMLNARRRTRSELQRLFLA